MEQRRLERQVLAEKRAFERANRPKLSAPRPKKTEWVIEGVTGMKEVNGKKYFRVKWEGYTKVTWEPEENLEGCEHLIEQHYADERRKMEQEKEDEELRKQWEAEGHYEVQKIVDAHVNEDGTRVFLIRWKFYGPKDDTWEPEENLDCDHLIVPFMEKWNKIHGDGLAHRDRELRDEIKPVKRLEAEFEDPKKKRKRKKANGRGFR